MQAFRRHFEHEFAIYEGDTIAINLIEKTGREKILGDAFLDYSIKMDDARLAYVSFDFHDYWFVHLEYLDYYYFGSNVLLCFIVVECDLRMYPFCWIDYTTSSKTFAIAGSMMMEWFASKGASFESIASIVSIVQM